MGADRAARALGKTAEEEATRCRANTHLSEGHCGCEASHPCAGGKQATRVQAGSKPPVCRCEASHIITIMLNTYKVVLTVSVII